MKSSLPFVVLSGTMLFFGLTALSCAAVHHNPPAAVPISPGVNSSASSGYSSRLQWINSLDPRTFAAPLGRNAYGAPKSTVTIPMCFPILGRGYDFADEFGAPRDGHRHLGQDLFAPKLTPLVAVFDGTIYFRSYSAQPGGLAPHNIIHLYGDNGYSVKYMHVNNDTPGTDDGRGGAANAFAPGLVSGLHVRAGQFLGWVGNSGNAESTPPHTHFELWGPDGVPVNPTLSLRHAARLKQAPADIPMPEWMPNASETRWDGLVRSVDAARGVIVMNLLATTTKGKTIANVRPGLTYVRVAPTMVLWEAGTRSAIRFSALQPGEHIALRGEIPGKKRFVARAATVTGMSDWRTVARNEALRAAPEKQAPVSDETHKQSPNLGDRISNWWNGVRRRGRL